MPRIFPCGVWQIYKPLPHPESDPYLYPFFIPTNAWQFVSVWILDSKGAYVKPDGEQSVRDTGYGLHFSSSDTTLGCLRIGNKEDLLYLVGRLNEDISKGEICKIHVTD